MRWRDIAAGRPDWRYIFTLWRRRATVGGRRVRLADVLAAWDARHCPAALSNWRDAWAILTTLPRTSMTARAALGEQAEWSLDTHLLAHVGDLLAAANWQRGQGKGPRPKPIKRPGALAEGETTFKLDRFDSPDEFEAWYARQLNMT